MIFNNNKDDLRQLLLFDEEIIEKIKIERIKKFYDKYKNLLGDNYENDKSPVKNSN